MSNINFDSQILYLSEKFYEKYLCSLYKEILVKKDRPYQCLLVHIKDYFICIPYRMEIRHSYAYKFKKSLRSRKHHSGLDYTKIVIVSDRGFLSAVPALIDDDEYTETIQNFECIRREAITFVDDYVSHCKGEHILHVSEFRRRYQFSPLPYFHKELHI